MGKSIILLIVVASISPQLYGYPRPAAHTPNSNAYKRSEFDSCHLRLEHSVAYPNLDAGSEPSNEDSVYAGNGFSYAINCHVNDPKMRAGDKYYVIDLIVYGPNQRVAKAWREQFTTANLMLNGKSFFLNKNLSFYSLGENNIVCGVNKYNSLQNKFTRICQNNITVNVTEKHSTVIKPVRKDHDDHLDHDVHDFFYFRTVRPQKTATTTQLTESISPEITRVDSQPTNLSAKALEIKRTDTNGSSSSVSAILPGENNFNPIPPILIGLIFFVIFLVSIGTIIYLTYNTQHEETISRRSDYSPVKVIVNEGQSSSGSSEDHHFDSSNNSSTVSSNNISVYNDRMIVRKI